MERLGFAGELSCRSAHRGSGEQRWELVLCDEWEQTYLDAYRSCNLCLRGRSRDKAERYRRDSSPCGTSQKENLLKESFCEEASSVRMAFVWRNRLVRRPSPGPVDYTCRTHAGASKPRLRRAGLTAQSSLSSSAPLGRPRGRRPPPAPPPRLLLASGSDHSEAAARPHLSTGPRV